MVTPRLSSATSRERGGALLAVLWISAALTAIAFAMATTIRTETERTSTHSDAVRTYFLATGAVERLRLWREWRTTRKAPDGTTIYDPAMPRVLMNFPAGVAQVDVVPEMAKLSINAGRPEDLFRLMVLLGVDEPRARQITAAILDWRTGMPSDMSLFDQYYLSLNPSFRGRHSSFVEIEELLLVRGMTPDLFYGSLVRNAEGRLVQQPGLRDCLSVYGSELALDANFSPPQVLLAAGIPPDAVAQIVGRRAVRPFQSQDDLADIVKFAGPSAFRLQVGGGTIYTFRATARLRRPDGQLSDMSRSVGAMLKFHPIKPRMTTPPVEVIRWYDN